jgi:hypothetical protein
MVRRERQTGKKVADIRDWRIIELTPAVGWVAQVQTIDHEIRESRLAAWALVEDGESRFVTGLIAVNARAQLSFAATEANFIGYSYRGDWHS